MCVCVCVCACVATCSRCPPLPGRFSYTLWAKLKAEHGSTTFNAEFDEEFEDGHGNVMNRKIYTDLARQGLLD